MDWFRLQKKKTIKEMVGSSIFAEDTNSESLYSLLKEKWNYWIVEPLLGEPTVNNIDDALHRTEELRVKGMPLSRKIFL